MIPLLHDFTGARVLVFGGGPVGARKARRFGSEAAVLVVSPDFPAGEFGGAERVRAAPDAAGVGTWIERADPALVVAATDDADLNAAIAAAAREAGVLVNRTDRDGSRRVGSVVVPATAVDGPVTVAVSTDGTSPALSGYLREQFERQYPAAGEMASLTAALRDRLAERDLPAADRRAALRAVVRSERVWKALDTRGANAEHVASDVIETELGDTT